MRIAASLTIATLCTGLLTGCEDSCTINPNCPDIESSRPSNISDRPPAGSDPFPIGGFYEGTRNGQTAIAMAGSTSRILVYSADAGLRDQVFTSGNNPFSDSAFARPQTGLTLENGQSIDSGNASGMQNSSGSLLITIEYDDISDADIALSRDDSRSNFDAAERLLGRWDGLTSTGLALDFTISQFGQSDRNVVGSDNVGCTYSNANVFDDGPNIFSIFVDRDCPSQNVNRLVWLLSVDIGSSRGGDRLTLISDVDSSRYISELRRQ
ncbi:hypothetical protein GYB61_12570 [bacterium]|nr:hypothetical protein [bacterium]